MRLPPVEIISVPAGRSLRLLGSRRHHLFPSRAFIDTVENRSERMDVAPWSGHGRRRLPGPAGVIATALRPPATVTVRVVVAEGELTDSAAYEAWTAR